MAAKVIKKTSLTAETHKKRAAIKKKRVLSNSKIKRMQAARGK